MAMGRKAQRASQRCCNPHSLGCWNRRSLWERVHELADGDGMRRGTYRMALAEALQAGLRTECD